MSILSVTELARQEGERDSQGGITYTRRFQVQTDDPETEPYTVLSATGIPALNEAYPGDSKAKCRSVRPAQDSGSRLVWEVLVEYSSARQSPIRTRTTRPWARPPKIAWGKHSRIEAVVKDKNGDPLRNSAHDRFDPPPTKEVFYPSVRIVRYERTYSMQRAILYLNHVNSHSFVFQGITVSAGEALCVGFQGTQVDVDGVECWEVEYEFYFAPTWEMEVLDQGYYFNSGGRRYQYTDSNGEPMKTPALLDGSGGKLTYPGGTPVFLSFDVYDTKDFRALGLT